MKRLSSLEDYKTLLTPDGKLNYKMLGIHLSRSFHGAYSDYHEHMALAAREAQQRFSQSTRELVGWDESDLQKTASSIFNGFAEKAFSLQGELNQVNPLELINKNIILTGLYFGSCHANAFYDLLDMGASEIHIPQDCTNGFYFDDYPEKERDLPKAAGVERMFCYHQNPFLDVRKNRLLSRYQPCRGLKRYQLFVPEQREPFLEHLKGEKPSLVVFHRSWREMMDFFEERR